jgi:quinol monooxygenase YgiN
MRYILTTRCRVQPGKMETFLRDVQQWEENALASPEAPSYHAVYLNRADPSLALVITQFDSKERADAFAATKLLESFHERILACVVESSDAEGYDLYYAAGSGGPRVVFGQDT